MSKKKPKQKAKSGKPKKSAAMKSKTASVIDIGQLFTNPGKIKMENIMTQGKSQFDKFTNDASNIGRDGFEAMNKSMSIFTKGFEELMRTSMALAQSTAEKQGQLIKDAMAIKSLNEFAEVQNRIAQENFDDCMAAAQKLSELGVKLMSQTAEPINAQFAKGMKKATESMAA